MKGSNEILEMWREIEDSDFHATENEVHPVPKIFTILSGAELRNVSLPPKVNVLGDGAISLGQTSTIIGQGGSGKSRIIVQIALS
jgi:hypothetical protein